MLGSSAKKLIAKRSLKCWFRKSRRRQKTQVIMLSNWKRKDLRIKS